MNYYALTVRKLAKNAQQDDYKVFLQACEDYAPLVEVHKIVYEKNHQRGGVHMHGLISLCEGFFRKNLCIRRFHVNMSELKSPEALARWDRYMNKEQDIESQVEKLLSTTNISRLWPELDTRERITQESIQEEESKVEDINSD